MLTRRFFLRNSALAMVGAGAAPLWLERALYAADAPSPRKKILVAIFQRGAADGLNIVVPHGEKRYYELRPTIAVPRPSRGIGTPRRRRDRPGWLLRPASRARPAQAGLGRRAPGHRARRRIARSHALALRCAGLHGIRHARPEGHRRRLDEPRAAAQTPAAPVSPVRAVAMGSVLPRAMRGAESRGRHTEPERLPGAQCRRGRALSRRCTPTARTRC